MSPAPLHLAIYTHCPPPAPLHPAAICGFTSNGNPSQLQLVVLLQMTTPLSYTWRFYFKWLWARQARAEPMKLPSRSLGPRELSRELRVSDLSLKVPRSSTSPVCGFGQVCSRGVGAHSALCLVLPHMATLLSYNSRFYFKWQPLSAIICGFTSNGNPSHLYILAGFASTGSPSKL